jgi:hypothetical protein
MHCAPQLRASVHPSLGAARQFSGHAVPFSREQRRGQHVRSPHAAVDGGAGQVLSARDPLK